MEANTTVNKLTFPPIPHYWTKVLTCERLALKYPPPAVADPNDIQVLKNQTLIAFLEHEEKGWTHLRCSQRDLSDLKPWELQRAWPKEDVNQRKFWEAHKRIMNRVEGQILQTLASEPQRLPTYILLNLKVYEKMDIFMPNCLLPGRKWKQPQNIIDLYVYFEAFTKLKGWRLPVPPLHSRQSYSKWYMEKTLAGTPDEYQTLMAIRERETQASNATFLRCLQKTYPIEFSDLMSFPIELFAFLFKQFTMKNGFPQPSYSLIENYQNQLSHPYFSRKIDTKIYQCPEKKKHREEMALLAKKHKKVQDEHFGTNEEVEKEEKEEKPKKKIVLEKEIGIFEYVEPNFRKEWEEIEGFHITLQSFDKVVKQRLAEEKKKIKGLSGIKKMQAQIKLENQYKQGLVEPIVVRCERVEELMQKINPSITLSQIITLEKKRFGIDYMRSPIDPINPEIFRYKKKNTVTYYGCPGCGQWRKKDELCTDCKNCALNNDLLCFPPRTATIPFAIQLMRSNTKHGLALCMLCHQCFSSRGDSYQHQCLQLREFYQNNPSPNPLCWGMNAKSYGVVLSKEKIYVMPIFMQQEQPLRPNMKLNSQIKCFECSPQLFAFEIRLLENDLPLRQTLGGIIALGDIEKGTKFGPIGGDIFPQQAYDFFPETSSVFNGMDNTTYTFGPIQNFIGLSFAKRAHNGSKLEPNCQILFGYVREKAHVRAFLKATKLICRGQAIILNRNMPTVTEALRFYDSADVVPCSEDGKIRSLQKEPEVMIAAQSESSISIRVRPNGEQSEESDEVSRPLGGGVSNVDYKPQH